MGKMILDWDIAFNFIVDAFVGYGVPKEDAKICADVLLESDRRVRFGGRRIRSVMNAVPLRPKEQRTTHQHYG